MLFRSEIDVPETVPPLRDAVESGAEMVLDHWSPESGETTRRTVAPIEIFRDGSHWYLRGIDRGAGAERTFRVDRILEWSPTGAVDRQPLTPRGAWFEDGHDLDEATLVVDRDRWWVLERYPIRAAETLADGRMRVRQIGRAHV